MSKSFETKTLGATPDAIAPDGSLVRLLLALEGGSFAHFELPAGQTSQAVTHRTVEEIWYVVAGGGSLWRRQDGTESIEALKPGTAITIPLGTHFQFRAGDAASLAFVAVTMPPWPGAHEAVAVEGRWTPGSR
jgi:mannose-6-phosphate isomerase-like protein (cupin superfamily)